LEIASVDSTYIRSVLMWKEKEDETKNSVKKNSLLLY